MDIYSQKGRSTAQKLLTITIELLLIYISYQVMFASGAAWVSELFGWQLLSEIPSRRYVIIGFSVVILLRMTFMMLYMMKRTMPWSEAFTIPAAFALYYVGFAILVLPNDAAMGMVDGLSIALFLFGCHLNTASEYQRHKFKLDPANKGKLYTTGLFGYSMHINYFGDILWVTGYAIIAGHIYGYIIPVMVACLFGFINIPMLDGYLRGRYAEFANYETTTKKLIPFIW